MADKIYVKFNQTGAQKYIVLSSGEPVTADRITEVSSTNTEAISYIEQGLFLHCEKEDYEKQSDNLKSFNGKGMVEMSEPDQSKEAINERIKLGEKQKNKLEEIKEEAKTAAELEIEKQVTTNQEKLNKNKSDKNNKPEDFKENTIVDGISTEDTLKE